MPIVRRSKKRDAILEVMRSTKAHPSADWIYQQMREKYPDVSLGTVYRNLRQLAEEGFVRMVGVVDGQERFDATVWDHAHFVCSVCGRVIDVKERLPEEMLSTMVSPEDEGEVQTINLSFSGICDECRRQ